MTGLCPLFPVDISQFKILISGNYNAFSDGLTPCGVYMVSGLKPSSTFEKPIYIGSSWDISCRIQRQHIPDLNSNEHDNPPLQSSWMKNCQENFVWFLVKECHKNEILKEEQLYLDYFGVAKNFKTFNICETAGRPPYFKGKDHPSYGKKFPDRSPWIKTFKVRDPNGKVILGKNITHFARKIQIQRSSLQLILNKGKTYQGYSFVSPDTPHDIDLTQSVIKTGPDGSP